MYLFKLNINLYPPVFLYYYKIKYDLNFTLNYFTSCINSTCSFLPKSPIY